MRQLDELTTLLINLDLVAAENIDGVADDPKFIPSGKVVTLDTGVNEPGIVLYRQSYAAVFNIDDYPFNEHPVEELFGQISAYLIENSDGGYDIPEPKTAVDILDNGTANIEVRIDFTEDVYAVEDPAGTIPLKGKMYRIFGPVIDYVQEGDVVT